MRKQAVLFCVFAVVIGFLMWTCSKNDNPTGPGGGGNNLQRVLTYTVSGDTIIVTTPQEISSYCYDTDLVSDTSAASIDTSTFILYGNTLTVMDTADTMVFTRVGTGSTIQGQWQGQIAIDRLANATVTLDITGTTITMTVTSFCMDTLIDAIVASFPQYYNVSAAKLSCSSFLLTGNTTGEQVTVSFSTAGDATFTSSNPQHAPGVVYGNPVSCPNDPPDWYALFLSENGAPVPSAKRAMVPSADPMEVLKKTVRFREKLRIL